MSDSCAKQHPMNGLQDFEAHLGQLRPGDHKGDDLLAELFRIISGQEESHAGVFDLESENHAEIGRNTNEQRGRKEPDAPCSMMSSNLAAIETDLAGGRHSQAGPAKPERSGCKTPDPRVPLLRDDFAEIEAGLLAGLGEQITASGSNAGMVPRAVGGSDYSLHAEDKPSLRAAARERRAKSRGPLYATAATVIAALSGIAVSFGLETQGPDPSGLATVIPEPAPAIAMQMASAQDVSAQEAAVPGTQPESAPIAETGDAERQAATAQPETAQPEEEAPAAAAAAVASPETAGGNVSAEVAASGPVQEQIPSEPVSAAQPAAPEKTIGDLIQSEVAPAPRSGPLHSEVVEAPRAPQRPAATATARPAKTAHAAAKTQKSAVAKVTAKAHSDALPRQIAVKIDANSPAPAEAVPAPVASAKPEAPVVQPNQPNAGAFGFIKTAMNTITNTTAKLLQWGGIDPVSHP